MKTFLMSDTHFECYNLIEETRSEWASPETHDEMVVDAINSTVKRQDRLIILGDFCKDTKRTAIWRQKIQCKHVHLVLGNHDKRTHAWPAFGMGNVSDTLELKVGPPEDRRKIFCSHYPHVHWPASHYGSYHAYGHVHGQKESELDMMMPERRSIDVGVDNAVRLLGSPFPFSTDELFLFLRLRAGHGLVKPEDVWKKREIFPDEM